MIQAIQNVDKCHHRSEGSIRKGDNRTDKTETNRRRGELGGRLKKSTLYYQPSFFFFKKNRNIITLGVLDRKVKYVV